MTQEVNGEITVCVEHGESGECKESLPCISRKALESKIVSLHPSRVRCSVGITKSLGPYESFRVDVSAEDFCEPDQKKETWHSLEKECLNIIEDLMEDFYVIKRRMSVDASISLDLAQDESDLPPAKRTRLLLNDELKTAAKEGKIDYDFAVKKLTQSKLTEGLVRQLIHDIREGEFSFFKGDVDGEKEQIDADRVEACLRD